VAEGASGVNEQKFQVVGLSPDSEAGYEALHLYLQDGYEPIYSYREAQGRLWINHVFLRFPVQEQKPE